ncbi:MAG: halocyanin domain-containing protein [Salinirussus sp.]
MSDGTADVTRRGLLAATAGGLAAATTVGPAAAQEGPDFGGWFDGVPNFDGVVDKTGNSEVTVTVGGEANNGFSFAPAAIRVDPGTNVVWEWSGEGGAHNVVADDGSYSSGSPVAEAGTTFSHTFESVGISKYFCQPHKSAGMKGAVVVGKAGGGGGDGGGGPPDFGGWFDDVPYFEETTDARGQSEVSVTVGGDANNNLSFLPAAIHIDNGAQVTWEWSGEGGAHNVVHKGGAFESELTGEEGFTFSYTFEEDGIYPYFCEPHRSAGMKGAIVVGTDYPTTGGGGDGGDGGGGPRPMPDSAMTLVVATSVVMTATLGMAYAFIKYGGAGGE